MYARQRGQALVPQCREAVEVARGDPQLCWGVFGLHQADPRLIVLGASGVVASLLVFARVSWLRADRAPATHLAEVP